MLISFHKSRYIPDNVTKSKYEFMLINQILIDGFYDAKGITAKQNGIFSIYCG